MKLMAEEEEEEEVLTIVELNWMPMGDMKIPGKVSNQLVQMMTVG